MLRCTGAKPAASFACRCKGLSRALFNRFPSEFEFKTSSVIGIYLHGGAPFMYSSASRLFFVGQFSEILDRFIHSRGDVPCKQSADPVRSRSQHHWYSVSPRSLCLEVLRHTLGLLARLQCSCPSLIHASPLCSGVILLPHEPIS